MALHKECRPSTVHDDDWNYLLTYVVMPIRSKRPLTYIATHYLVNMFGGKHTAAN